MPPKVRTTGDRAQALQPPSDTHESSEEGIHGNPEVKGKLKVKKFILAATQGSQIRIHNTMVHQHRTQRTMCPPETRADLTPLSVHPREVHEHS